MSISEFEPGSPERQRLKKIYFDACEEYECNQLDPLIDIIEGHSTTGSHLDLKGNLKVFRESKLRDNDLHAMFLELQTDTFVTIINLAYNNLSGEVCVSLGKALVKNKTIKELDLTMCDINIDGCYAISKGLEYNACLEKIVLCGNKFGPEGCASLAAVLQINNTLKSLDIASTDQNSQSLIPLCTVLTMSTSIEHLDISRTVPYTDEQTLTDHFSRLLSINRTLISLKISNCDVTDSGASSLAFYLRGNTSLKHLTLSNNKISSDGAIAFADLLKINSTLEELSLCSNRIGDTGMIAISEVIACRNSSLKTLGVTSNSISGVGLSSLAAALRTNKTLTNVHIWGNNFDEKACNAFKILCCESWTESEPRLKVDDVDVKVYNVDNVNYLAESRHHTFSHE